ncbi:Uncharacterised protein [uncultured archaeon]|nr:Uncharacterised protein [uncultured archaeon]
MRPRMPDSSRNIIMMSEFFAPIAFMTPISWVLSSTDVYIVFIMPMPPTSSEIAAIPMITVCTVAIIPRYVVASCSNVWTLKSSSPFFSFLSFLIASAMLSATSPGGNPFFAITYMRAYPGSWNITSEASFGM